MTREDGIIKVKAGACYATLVGQSECDELGGITTAADGNDDVLLAVQHIGHRRPGLRSRHVDRANLLAVGFVVGPEHGPSLPGWRGEETAFAGDQKRFGDQCTYPALPACPRDFQTFERRVIANVVRSLTVRDLPDHLLLF